jgi:xanthine dehydrogenase accessory factor
VRYGVSDADAAAIGLSCGGEIEVLVTAHDPGDPVWQRLVTSVAAGEEVVLLTRAGDRNPGRQLLLTADGEQVGTLGSAGVDRAAATEGAVALESRAMPRLTTLPDGDRVFIEPMLRPRRLFAVGATPIARALARLGGIVDVPVTIVDPREPLAREAQAEGLEPVIAAPGVAFESARIGPGDGVAVLAHDMRLDLAGLRAALDGRAGYIGLLGGRRTQKTRRDQLLEQGVDPEAVEAIRGPIGLDIGAESPAEIALSILSEVLLHWNRPGTLRPDRP